ncbi:uncharacterized protein LOC131207199 [Anopheles bellator]|uniref:uncharacterized protein LOC131207199 n=1 Tax=Anopheles bellator TaxID=139047 RepID=UPI002649E95D|nr:uncharacterized protein LOC131207199 [Anopheles bellator]
MAGAGVTGSPMEDRQQQRVLLSADDGAARRQEKRGIGLATTYSGLTGFGYDTSLGLTGYPTAYVTPTVIKSTYTVPAAATYHAPIYHDATQGKYAYGGFYPSTGYGGFGTGYTGFAAPAATYTKILHPATTYSKILHPATSTYTKVIQTYPPATVGVVAPAVNGYSGVASLGGYVY